MSGIRWASAALTLLFATIEARAQFIAPPFGYYGDGIGFQYRGRRMTVAGFFGHGGASYYNDYPPIYLYGPPPSRVVYYAPAPALSPARIDAEARRRLREEIAGVDLDLIPVKKKTTPPKAIEMPGVDVSVPKKPVRPEDVDKKQKPAPEIKKPKAPVLPPPKADPIEENARLTQIGLDAFREQDYGIAALRFGQAVEVEPTIARAHFLLAQANLAIGKYKDAVRAIEVGMKRQPDCPKKKFHPRLELYKGMEPEFDDQLARLRQALDRQPDHPTYLFLYAYALWFDGKQADAVPFFQRARARVADPTFIDAFLKAAPGGVVAAN